MRPAHILLSSLLAFGSAGLLPAHASGLPVCNGKHKRPANPYGSVLSEGLKPAASNGPSQRPDAEPAVSGAQASPAVTTGKPSQASRSNPKASFVPCGGGPHA